MLSASDARNVLCIILYSSCMLVSLYFSLVGSEPLTTYAAGVSVTSKTRSLYRAWGYKTPWSVKIWWSSLM